MWWSDLYYEQSPLQEIYIALCSIVLHGIVVAVNNLQ